MTRSFSRLIRALAQPNTKVVLSLGAGGIRMAAQLPLLKFLERIKAQKYLSEIWGVSGGAMIGLGYSMGVPPARIEEVMLKNVEKVKLVPSYFSMAKNILWEALLFRQNEKDFTGFHDCQAALQNLVGETVKGGKPRYAFYCLAYNLKAQRIDVLTPQALPPRLYSSGIYTTDPLEAVIASSAIPILYVPKVIDDKNGRRVYVDGATGEELPTVSIYKKWIRDRETGRESRKHLLVIGANLNPYLASHSLLENWLLKRIPAFQYLRMAVHFTDLIRKARLEEQKHTLMDDPNVEFWDLNLCPKERDLMDVREIPRILQEAEKHIPEAFAKINDSLLG